MEKRQFNKANIDQISPISLDKIFILFLKLLSDKLITINSVDQRRDDKKILSESKVNQYQFISINGIPNSIDDIYQFTREPENFKSFVDAAEAYSNYTEPEYSITKTRKEGVEVFFSKDSSVRKHLVHQINAYRIFAISAIS